MKKVALFPIILLFLISCGQDFSLTSPNGEITLSVKIVTGSPGTEYGNAYFTIAYSHGNGSEILLEEAGLGMITNKRNFGDNNLKIVSISAKKTIEDDYRMVTGKRSHCTNRAFEKTYRFENERKQIMDITFRLYNDGVAFRYTIVSPPEENEHITEELTSYPVPEGTKRWMQPYDPTYERFYPLATNGASTGRRNTNMWGYPALVEKDNSIFILISEADIQRGHCGSRLNNKTDANRYKVDLADDMTPCREAWSSPWRVLIIGSLADIVESTLVADVSEPSKVQDLSWIIPGPVSWIYWAHNHGSKDYQIVTKYIDLAIEMKWPYNLIDAEWDVMDNGGKLEDAIQYSLNKGIKPLLWYNSGTAWTGPGAPGPLDRLNLKENRENEYAWLKKISVAGIKVDFFKGDDAKTMNYYIDLLEDAIKHKLMINFHGATVPRGWQRTYPHMMSVEGVYGAEWYNNAPVLTNAAARHNATLPFTRNVIGPMDYTPGTFSDSQHPHITSHGHELALCIVFESALQHMPDRPSSYLELPEPVKTFLSELPTAWDDTKLLSGYPGEEVIIARRKGNAWYIGGLNGTDNPRKLVFTPSSLTTAGKTMTIFADGENDRSFTIEKNASLSDLNNRKEIDCLPRGGFVAIIVGDTQ